MKILFLVFAHMLATIVKLLRSGGAKALVSENLLLKQQLLIIERSRKRAPNLTPLDRLYLGLVPPENSSPLITMAFSLSDDL